MPILANLVIRDTTSAERTAVVDVLVDAFTDGAVTRWAEPDPVTRTHLLRANFSMLVEHAAVHGMIRLADRDRHSVGVAVWYRYPQPDTAADVHDIGGAHPEDPPGTPTAAATRLTLLEGLLAGRHPTQIPHWYLAYLGVTTTAQNTGVGTALITEHPDRDRLPAYLEANDTRNRSLYRRLGFLDHGRPITGHDGPPVFPMWRPPAAA